MSIGQRIKAVMEATDLSANKFAHVLGVSDKTLYNYFSGKTLPNINIIEKIITAWGVSADWILAGKGEMNLHNANPIDSPISIAGEPLEEWGSDDKARIQYLEQLLEEKERLIKVLMKQQGFE